MKKISLIAALIIALLVTLTFTQEALTVEQQTIKSTTERR